MGGYFYPLVQEPSGYVAELTDADLLVSGAWEFDPFPALAETHNAVAVTYTSPAALWGAEALEPIVQDDWVAHDGGQRLAELKLPMVYNAAQARQLGNAFLKENRRFKGHRVPLPPDFANLRPLQAIRWTSEQYGYQDKLFLIKEMAYDLRKLTAVASLRELDPADYAIDLALELPEATLPAPVFEPSDDGVPGFAVTGIRIKDEYGNDRSAAIRAVWYPDLADTADAVSFQARLANGNGEETTASTSDVRTGRFNLDQVVSGAVYEVRAKSSRSTNWGAWLTVTVPDVRIGPEDLSDAVTQALEAGEALLNIEFPRTLQDLARQADELDQVAESGISAAIGDLQDRRAQRQDLASAKQEFSAGLTEGEEAIAQVKTDLEAQISDANAQIDGDASARATETAAQTQQHSALSATVGSLSATVVQQSAAIVSQGDGIASLSASVAVQTNVNGHIAGWALSTEVDGENTPWSKFIIAADEFRVGSADGEYFPFMILTAPTEINGQTVPPGVYMRATFLYDAMIQAKHIDTDSFQAAGMSILGGVMKSDNFDGTINETGNITDWGTTGFALTQSGKFVGTQIIAREALAIGATIDANTHVAETAVHYGNGVTVCELALGPLELGRFWDIVVQFERRCPHTDGGSHINGQGDPFIDTTYHQHRVYLQWRTKTGGTWSSWGTIHDFGYPSSKDLAWRSADASVRKVGIYDDVEVRLQATWENVGSTSTSGTGTGPTADYTSIRNLMLVAASPLTTG